MSLNIPETTVAGVAQMIKTIVDELMTTNPDDAPGFFIHGSPGIGKSALVKQLATSLKRKLYDVRLSLIEPTELKGLPYYNQEAGTTIFLPTETLPPHKGTGKYILFLDELNTAPPVIQAQAYQLILDKKLGTYQLPKDTIVIAAGNKQTDGVPIYQMSTALSNRFTHLELIVSADEWFGWALANNVDELIIAFLKHNPQLLHKFDGKKSGLAFPTPRSWTFVSAFTGLRESTQTNAFRQYFQMIEGTIGSGATTEFQNWLRYKEDIPDPETILNGKEYEFPKETSMQYLMMGYLLRSLFQNMTMPRLKQYFSYVENFEGTAYADLAVAHISSLITKARSVDPIGGKTQTGKKTTGKTTRKAAAAQGHKNLAQQIIMDVLEYKEWTKNNKELLGQIDE